MENNFKFEIISPEKIIFSDSDSFDGNYFHRYEGDMSILKRPYIN